jgi:hypothetical protein
VRDCFGAVGTELRAKGRLRGHRADVALGEHSAESAQAGSAVRSFDALERSPDDAAPCSCGWKPTVVAIS